MYLAAIADSQPQPSPMPGQVHAYFHSIDHYNYTSNHFESIKLRTCWIHFDQ